MTHDHPRSTAGNSHTKLGRFGRLDNLFMVALIGLVSLTGCQTITDTVSSVLPKDFATPPMQPEAGPGGFDYKYSGVKQTTYGRGELQYWIFEPTDPKPQYLPVVVFLHGWLEMTPFRYEAWIEHIVRRGHVVVYPRFQTNALTSTETFTENSILSIRSALVKLNGRDHVRADRTKMILVGHSVGSMIAANIASLHQSSDLPEPKALMAVHAAPTWFMPVEDPARMPSKMLLLTVVGDQDWVVRSDGGRYLYLMSTQIHHTRKGHMILTSDDHGKPPLVADHNGPFATKWGSTSHAPVDLQQRSMPPDALDYFGYWKLFDALSDAAIRYKNYHYALGNSAQQRFMGRWSDGSPVREPIVFDNPMALGSEDPSQVAAAEASGLKQLMDDRARRAYSSNPYRELPEQLRHIPDHYAPPGATPTSSPRPNPNALRPEPMPLPNAVAPNIPEDRLAPPGNSTQYRPYRPSPVVPRQGTQNDPRRTVPGSTSRYDSRLQPLPQPGLAAVDQHGVPRAGIQRVDREYARQATPRTIDDQMASIRGNNQRQLHDPGFSPPKYAPPAPRPRSGTFTQTAKQYQQNVVTRDRLPRPVPPGDATGRYPLPPQQGQAGYPPRPAQAPAGVNYAVERLPRRSSAHIGWPQSTRPGTPRPTSPNPVYTDNPAYTSPARAGGVDYASGISRADDVTTLPSAGIHPLSAEELEQGVTVMAERVEVGGGSNRQPTPPASFPPVAAPVRRDLQPQPQPQSPIRQPNRGMSEPPSLPTTDGATGGGLPRSFLAPPTPGSEPAASTPPATTTFPRPGPTGSDPGSLMPPRPAESSSSRTTGGIPRALLGGSDDQPASPPGLVPSNDPPGGAGSPLLPPPAFDSPGGGSTGFPTLDQFK